MSFSEETISRVWEKGRPVEGLSQELIRVDDFGEIIVRDEYGNGDSEFGWEIDHILPPMMGASNDIRNLRPLHWLPNGARQPRSRLFQAENCDYRERPAGDETLDVSPTHESPGLVGSTPNLWDKSRPRDFRTDDQLGKVLAQLLELDSGQD